MKPSAPQQLSVEQALERNERRFRRTLRAQQDYEKIRDQMNLASVQNPALQARVDAVLARAKRKQ